MNDWPYVEDDRQQQELEMSVAGYVSRVQRIRGRLDRIVCAILQNPDKHSVYLNEDKLVDRARRIMKRIDELADEEAKK